MIKKLNKSQAWWHIPVIPAMQEYPLFRPAQANKFTRLHLNKKKLGMGVLTYNPSYSSGGLQSRAKARNYLKNNQSKKGSSHC
jgi:hypothetical protein